MQPPSACPACSVSVPAGERFCPNCGLLLGSTPAQAAAPSLITPAAPAPEPAALRIGQKLAGGRYTLSRHLSRGGMGQLYLAVDHEAFDRQVVVKVMIDYFDPSDPAEAQAARDRFLTEARTLAGLRHPGIPQIYGYFQEGQRNLIVMEYIEGHDLSVRLSRADDATGAITRGAPAPAADVARWGAEICKVLEYLAAQRPPVIHHDIKPANLLLDRNSGEVRLVDFGTAKARLRPSPGGGVGLQQTSVYGTQGYAAPEQYRGESEPRSDVYALAATLYHLLTDDDPGAHPLQFPRLDALGPIGALLRAALATQPDQRPSAGQLRLQLEQLADGDGAQPSADPAAQRAIETPDGVLVSRPEEVARWALGSWDEAAHWLYGRLPDQVELRWGRSSLARELRAVTQVHAYNQDRGLDDALRLLDPSLPPPQLQASPGLLDFGAVTQQDEVSAQVWLYASGGALDLTLQAPAWLELSDSDCAVRPGLPVQLNVTLHPTRQPGTRMQGAIAAYAEGAQLLDVPVAAELATCAPDGHALPDLASLAAWCEAHPAEAARWLLAPEPASLARLVESAFGDAALAQRIRSAARADEAALALDAALALLDPGAYGAEQPQLTLDPPEIRVTFRTARGPQRLRVTNSGRRPLTLRARGPHWLRVDTGGDPTLAPGESAAITVTLDRSALPLLASLRGALRLGASGADPGVTAPVSAALPPPARSLLRYPAPTVILALLLAALLWLGGSAAAQQIGYSREYQAGLAAQESGDLAAARAAFERARSWRPGDAAVGARLAEIAYQSGAEALKRGDWATARAELAAVGDVGDAPTLLRESYYRPALAAIEREDWDEAAAQIAGLEGIDPAYRDIQERVAAEPALAAPLSLARWSSGRVGAAFALEGDGPLVIGERRPEALSVDGGSLALVDLRTGQTLPEPNGMPWMVSFAPRAMSADGQRLAYAAARDVTVVRRDGSTLAELPELEGVAYLTFSPDGRVLAVEQIDRAMLVRLDDLSGVAQLDVTRIDGPRVRFSPDGSVAAVATDSALQLVRLSDGHITRSLPAAGLAVFGFSPDGATLVTFDDSDRTIFWRVADGVAQETLVLDRRQFRLGYATGLRFSPDGQWLSIVSNSGVLIYQLSGARTTLFFPEGSSAAFSPDARLLAVGSSEGALRRIVLYALPAARELQQFGQPTPETPSDRFTTLAFSSDGGALVSQTASGDAVVWKPLAR